jgi:hypothetical protein
MSNFNPKRRAAVFEKLRNSGKLSTNAPRVPTPHPKLLTAPPAPVMPAGAQMPTAQQVNPNFIGNAKQQRFSKIKKMFGLP